MQAHTNTYAYTNIVTVRQWWWSSSAKIGKCFLHQKKKLKTTKTKNWNNRNSRRLEVGNRLCCYSSGVWFSGLGRECLLAKPNKCLEQTVDHKKGQSSCLFMFCCVFAVSNMESTVQTQSHAFPTWRDRFRGSEQAELIKPASRPLRLSSQKIECMSPVMDARNSTAQTVGSQFKVGSASTAVPWPPLRVLFFFNAHGSKPSTATCSDTHSSHTALVYTSTQQKHNILEKKIKTHTHSKEDKGERCTSELVFRLGLVARLDNTTSCTKVRLQNASVGSFSRLRQFCSLLCLGSGFWG